MRPQGTGTGQRLKFAGAPRRACPATGCQPRPDGNQGHGTRGTSPTGDEEGTPRYLTSASRRPEPRGLTRGSAALIQPRRPGHPRLDTQGTAGLFPPQETPAAHPPLPLLPTMPGSPALPTPRTHPHGQQKQEEDKEAEAAWSGAALRGPHGGAGWSAGDRQALWAAAPSGGEWKEEEGGELAAPAHSARAALACPGGAASPFQDRPSQPQRRRQPRPPARPRLRLTRTAEPQTPPRHRLTRTAEPQTPPLKHHPQLGLPRDTAPGAASLQGLPGDTASPARPVPAAGGVSQGGSSPHRAGGAMLCGAPALSSPRCGSGAVPLRDGPSRPSCTGSRAAASSGRGSVNRVVCKHQKVALKNFGFGLIWLQSH